MSKEIVKVANNLPVALTTLNDTTTLAKSFAQAHILGSQNPAEGLLALMLIKELGLVNAEANYQIVMGKPSKKAHAILADFVKAGGRYKILERSDKCAKIEAQFGDNEGVYQFTWEDAQQEPFVYDGKPGEQRRQLTLPIEERKLKAKYATPRSRMQMLWVRLISDTCNALCPSSGGMYPPEMVEDFEDTPPREALSGTPKTIDIDQAQEVINHMQEVSEEPTTLDFSRCPIANKDGDYLLWTEISTAKLEQALQSEKIDEDYKEEIRAVLQQRREG